MKGRKFYMIWVLSLLFTSTVVSCNADSGVSPVIGFTPAEPSTIAYYGDTCELKVIANGDWSIREGDILNATSSVSGGVSGATELQLIIDPNPSATEIRDVSVRFTLLTGDSTQGFIIWRTVQDSIGL